MDLDRLDFDTTAVEGSQRSTLSPHSSQQVGVVATGSQQDIGGLIIPQSASSFMGGLIGGFGAHSAEGSARRELEGVLLDDDLGLMVGDNGALFDDLPVRQPTVVPSGDERTQVSGISSKARRDGEGIQGVVSPLY